MGSRCPHSKNPFTAARHLRHSFYCKPPFAAAGADEDVRFTRAQAALALLRRQIVEQEYTCIGAQAAFNQGAYRLGVYDQLGSAEAAAGLARDLWTFIREQVNADSDFMTFLAVFARPARLSESAFETLLWKQLQLLHEEDRHHHAWDETVAADPEDPAFSYSFAGHAFYIVGGHPRASRPARLFSFPLLAFNAHAQFERLRAQGVYPKMQRVIRQRERRLHGSINPMLSDFGERSEARQYSGRAVGHGWRCPFTHRTSNV